MSSNLPFFAADTLGMTLYQVENQLVSQEYHRLMFGAWRLDVKFDAVSDLITGKELTFWVTINDRLPLYFVCRDKESWLLVLDPALVPAKKKLKGLSLREMIVAVKPALKRVFRWKDDKWKAVEYDGTEGVH